MARRNDIRNIGIVAHVDHGKTTLVDAMLKQAGVFKAHETVAERVMDSMSLEREKGITIMAKNTGVTYKGTRINIVDTPGHADFGGEVERTLMMVDGILLLVDAAEGPLPQTRFILQKAMGLGLPVAVVINKIDRSDARPQEVLNEVYDLFINLGAHDHQIEFPVVYAIGRDGTASLELATPGKDLKPLFDTIVSFMPGPDADVDGPLQFRVNHLGYDDYVGRLAVGRIHSGKVTQGMQCTVCGREGKTYTAKVTQVYTYQGLKRTESKEATAGDIICLAGIEELEIGDTICNLDQPAPLPRIAVDEPTLAMLFCVNDGPFAGREGRYVTSRQIRERLIREARNNVAIRVMDTDVPDKFRVVGRGELQLAIVIETMRREGYELCVSRPEVVVKEIDGAPHEPVEMVILDIPEQALGAITESLGPRKGQMLHMEGPAGGRARLEFRVPTRGLIGFRGQFLTLTRGLGIMNTLFDSWQPYQGEIPGRPSGAIVADRVGPTTPYAIFHLQPRGILFVGPQTEVYEGMMVGEHNRDNDIDVNICREKKLTNIRAAGRDENIILTPPRMMSLEQYLGFIDTDELVEVTPKSIRLRKKILKANLRPRPSKHLEDDDD
ncbi:MAG: translational GTPase TypA [Deltaproteobacteria bacterium]|nr:translational GTPase TypA [Deltaproteobacteria bacterium]